MSLIPSPSYLTAAPAGGGIDKLDKNLMAGQVATFANVLRRLETKTAAQIGKPVFPV